MLFVDKTNNAKEEPAFAHQNLNNAMKNAYQPQDAAFKMIATMNTSAVKMSSATKNHNHVIITKYGMHKKKNAPAQQEQSSAKNKTNAFQKATAARQSIVPLDETYACQQIMQQGCA